MFAKVISGEVASIQQFARLPHRYGNSRATWITQCYLPSDRGDIPDYKGKGIAHT